MYVLEGKDELRLITGVRNYTIRKFPDDSSAIIGGDFTYVVYKPRPDGAFETNDKASFLSVTFTGNVLFKEEEGIFKHGINWLQFLEYLTFTDNGYIEFDYDNLNVNLITE